MASIKISGGNTFDFKRKQRSFDKQLTKDISSNMSKIQFADICHRKTNGANNWAKFKETEKLGMSTNRFKINKTENVNVKIKAVDNCKKFNELQITQQPQRKHSNDENGPISSVPKRIGNNAGNRNYNNQYIPNHIHNFKPKLTKCIAIDCEMVGVDEDAKTNMLARVSVVNWFGDCIYDKFVKPIEPVKDYRTFVSGIRPQDLENGEDFEKVQKEIAIILKGRTLVGHALKNDLTVLFLSHPRGALRDTSRYKKLQEGFKSTPSLKKLSAKYLNVNIQEGEHNSIEDAKAAMMLYMMFRKDWEAEIRHKRTRRNQRADSKANQMITSDDV